MKKNNQKKKKVVYVIKLHDWFEGNWVDPLVTREFGKDEREKAIETRNKLNLTTFHTIHPEHDHFGVIRMTGKDRGNEIECPRKGA